MSHILKHWREAATLLLVAKTKVPAVTSFQTTNFEVLMLKRSGKSKFMPKLHVFPGGVAHDSDFSAEWMDLFGKCGDTCMTNLQGFLKRGGVGVPMFSRTRPEEFSKVPSELAFRICAIRETFEESGILIVRDAKTLKNQPIYESNQPVAGKTSIVSDSILEPWREKVNDDASQFIVMCKELDILPDIWSLYEWSNWLTPLLPPVARSGKAPGRRYDTAFYICVLDYIPNAVHCDKETTELEWSSAGKFLTKHRDPEVKLELAPPQVVELGRILHFTDAEVLKKFSWDRSEVRVQRWYPVICQCADALIFLYPGDQLYPEDPDLHGDREMMTVTGTREELRVKFPVMNRSEAFAENGKLTRTFVCNVKMADGQMAPLFENTFDTLPQSRM